MWPNDWMVHGYFIPNLQLVGPRKDFAFNWFMATMSFMIVIITIVKHGVLNYCNLKRLGAPHCRQFSSCGPPSLQFPPPNATSEEL